MLSGWQFALVGLAAVAGGAVDALAGGGTLLTFPMLTAVGIPADVVAAVYLAARSLRTIRMAASRPP